MKLTISIVFLCIALSAARSDVFELRADSATVAQYRKINFTLAGVGKYANPYDPDQIDIVLDIKGPGGRKLTLPAFYCQDYLRRNRDRNGQSAAWFYPTGSPHWRARFAPSQSGNYACVARLRDAKGESTSNTVRIKCTASASEKGFLRVSAKDPRFLAFDNSAPFFAIGQNVAFIKELNDAERILHSLGANGANFARVWTCCDDWGMALESRKSAWGRSWSWKPPFSPDPDNNSRLCVKVDGNLDVSPSEQVGLRAGSPYVISGMIRADSDVSLTVSLAGSQLGNAITATRAWSAFERRFTAGENTWWLEGLHLAASGGAAYVRDLSLKEAGGGPELLWEADPNRRVMGNVSQTDAAILDNLVESAEKSGIYLQLCLLARDIYMNRLANKGSREYSEAIADAKKIVRYAVARWGYSTHVAAWEYWNEQNPGLPTDRFYTELGQYLKAIDPYRHLRDTSAWGDAPNDWKHPELDIANMHWYMRPAEGETYRDEVAGVLLHAKTLRGLAPNKPALFAEFGLAGDDWQMNPLAEQPPYYCHLHNALWTSALSGLSGTVMHWWWEDIDKRQAYGVYKGVSAFVADIPFDSVKIGVAAAVCADARYRCVGLKSKDHAWLWLSDSNATWWRRVVDKTEPDLSTGLKLTVTGLSNGTYAIRWFNTTDASQIRIDKMQCKNEILLLSPPPFTSDIACKAVRILH